MRSPRHFRVPSLLLTLATAVAVGVAGLPGAAAAREPAPPAETRAAAPAPRAAAAAGPRDFFYDAAGQLAGVTDPATGSAAYRYDDAGNLLRTERLAAGALAVFALVPARGPVGSSVEIGGTGFSATTGGNDVTVDGIAATVSRATTGRLQVQIPAGATDGVVRVSAGGRSATAPRPFRIEAGAPASRRRSRWCRYACWGATTTASRTGAPAGRTRWSG
jgi:YD repeat-containing protein